MLYTVVKTIAQKVRFKVYKVRLELLDKKNKTNQVQ